MMGIVETRRKVDAQYRATHDRMQGDAEYKSLMRAAEVEQSSTPESYFARNSLALFIEINTPLFDR